MAKKKSDGKSSERKEAWMRIIVLIVSGIVLGLWKVFVQVLAVVKFVYAIFSGKRMKNLAEMGETWNTQNYTFFRYMMFESNFRPFPFTKLQKSMGKFQK